MAYSELDRTLIRHYLGFGAIFGQADPRLESAVTASQSLADGGSRPDSNGENYVKGIIYGTIAQAGVAVTPGPTTQSTTFAMPSTIGLLNLEQQIQTLYPLTFINKADQEDAVIDAGRGMIILRIEGQRMANVLAKFLGMKRPRADIFFPDGGGMADNSEPFTGNESRYW
jgi:hypothetical protein